jgi:D-alanyl-D-alanine carboxypeptidase/D-alanyl-D-alanine-endopeptidase (penicillin-binding protein 4)
MFSLNDLMPVAPNGSTSRTDHTGRGSRRKQFLTLWHRPLRKRTIGSPRPFPHPTRQVPVVIRFTPVALVAILLAGSPAPAPAADTDLARKLEAVMDGPDFKLAHWGVLVVDAKTGEEVYARSADKMFAPASVTKLFTTAAALAAFGADHKFETPVYAIGERTKDGALKGDLVLVAKGDLAFGGRCESDGKLMFRNGDHTYANSGLMECEVCNGDPVAALAGLAKQVKDAGITEVRGEVLIDDRLFSRTRSTGSGPEVVSPVVLNDNVLDLVVTPGEKKGDPAKVTVTPASKLVTVDADLETGGKLDAAAVVWSQVSPGQFVVRGRVPVGGKPVVRILPIDDPVGFARSLFVEELRKAGVKVSAAVARPAPVPLPAPTAYAGLKPVAVHTSAPLGEALKITLKVSHNLYASTLPCLVAAKAGKTELVDGLKAQRRFLKGLGVDVETVSFGGGAGGSGVDLVTPRATVQLLQGLAKRPDWAEYKSWLPVLGEDGTLAEAVDKDSPARGHVVGKTGTYVLLDTMNNRPFLKSKALAGAMTTKGGRELLYVMMVNDVPLQPGGTASRVGKVLGRLCEIVYEGL